MCQIMKTFFAKVQKTTYLCRMKIAIIGAGAAGCFCAVNVKRMLQDAVVEVFEANQKPLAKVAITGGGRCNLTNTFRDVKSLQHTYPRGHKLMKRLFHQLDQQQLMAWFEQEGVKLTVQEDQCVFPASQDAMEIVDTLVRGMRREGVILHCNQRVISVRSEELGVRSNPSSANNSSLLTPHSSLKYRVSTECRSDIYDAVVVTTGGSPKASGLDFLSDLHLELEPPVPSLFTFKINDPITQLMGVVVEETVATLAGTKMKAEGPLLITHWGMSGPAILKLSSLAARHLAENDYKASLNINWLNGQNEDSVREQLESLLNDNPQKQIGSVHLTTDHKLKTGATSPLTSRLWHYLLEKSGIAPERRCAEVGRKQINKLASILTCDTYALAGQTRFKEEFVTCGGVALSNVDPNTLQSRQHPGLFLAGEVLDVDAITGGFNLQAAWTMGFVVAQNLAAYSSDVDNK